MCLEHCLIFIINIFNVPLALVNDSFWHVLGKSNILIRHSHDSQAGVQNTKKGLNARGMVMSSFLDKGGYYSGTWSPIFMKFCMVGTFLVYFEGLLSFWPSDLHGGRSGIPPFQLKKSLWNISVHKNYPLCEVRTSKNAMASE